MDTGPTLQGNLGTNSDITDFLSQMQAMNGDTSPAEQDHITGTSTNPEWLAAR